MPRSFQRWTTPAALLLVLLSGCTSFRDYIHNGLKVGPNYHRPPALAAEHWIDANDKRVRSECDDLSSWWTVFNDPLLNQLMQNAYQQNLTVREAGFRVLESRARLAIARGEFFPQSQTANGSFTRSGVGQVFSSSWNFNFNLAWELDFWGRFRRAIIAAEDTLDQSVYDYDDMLVTMLADVANAYVQIRTDQEQIRLLQNTVRVQENVLTFIDIQLKTGFHGVTDLDKAQALSNLRQSQAQIAQFQIDMRTNENSLCTLLGIPVVDIEPLLNTAPNKNIPIAPDAVVVGVPADLLRRRPDVRKAERAAAAQSEQIGIAETDLYPAFSINGTLGWQASTFSNLFSPQAFNSSVGPSFNWKLLNYGRIVNNERLQDATFRELVTTYQQTILTADQEVEDGIVTFLKEQERAKLLRESVDAAYLALEVIIAQYQNPTTIAGAGADFNRYAVILQNLITQQAQWTASRGQIALGLIETYRALGGGWQIRCTPPVAPTGEFTNTGSAVPLEEIPLPDQNHYLPSPPSAVDNPAAGSGIMPPPAAVPGAQPSSSAPATAPEVVPLQQTPAPANDSVTPLPTPLPDTTPSSSAPASAPQYPIVVQPRGLSDASTLRVLPTPGNSAAPTTTTPPTSGSSLELPKPLPPQTGATPATEAAPSTTPSDTKSNPLSE